jgi:hypothetical protein
VAARNGLAHSCWRCQPSGRCTVRCPRPWRAVRPATFMRSAQGGAAGFGAGEAGQGAGGAQQVAADRGERDPDGVRGE